MKKSKSKPPPKIKTQFAPAVEDDEASTRDLKHSRLIDKAELLKRVPVTFPTIWQWMREGKFPRSRNIGGKAAWLESDIEAWIQARPKNVFKGEEVRS